MLSFAEIGHVAVLVHPPIEIACPALAIAAARDQHVAQLAPLQKHLKALHKALDERTAPPEGDLVLLEISKEPVIPDKSLGQRLLRLEPERKGEVVLVGEVKTAFEDDVVLSDLPVNLLAFWAILEDSVVGVPQEEER